MQAGIPLQFPRDHGSHPAYRTEWWYITGWLRDAQGREYGMQLTFFRHRTGLQEDNASRFAPTQLLFAHAALTDPKVGKLMHDERAARSGFGLAYAREGDTDVRIDQWTLRRAQGRYITKVQAEGFGLDLQFAPVQAVLLQGEKGFSRKGPLPHQASYYYSLPQLEISGAIRLAGQTLKVSGRAWLDHEWSTEYLAKEAQGWDWFGINLHDGSALMGFRIRDTHGNSLWVGGSHRDGQGNVRVLSGQTLSFTPVRHWRSPRTGSRYPIEIRVRAGDLDLLLVPLIDDQELDARASTGTIYWEGAVRVRDAAREVGRGYLELTGYAQRLRM